MNKLCLYSVGKIWVFHGFAHFPQSFPHEKFGLMSIMVNIFIGGGLYKKLMGLSGDRALTAFVTLGYDDNKILIVKRRSP